MQTSRFSTTGRHFAVGFLTLAFAVHNSVPSGTSADYGHHGHQRRGYHRNKRHRNAAPYALLAQSRMLSTIVSVNAMLRSRCDSYRRQNFCGADPWPKMSASIPPAIRAADSCTESRVGSA